MAEKNSQKCRENVGYDNPVIQKVIRETEEKKKISPYSKARFENVLQAGEEEQNDMFDMRDEVKNITACLPSEENVKDVSRLLKLGESRARFFVCCELTIAENIHERINHLPDDLETRSLLLRLTRSASFLRLTTFSEGPKIGEGGYAVVYLTRTEFSPKLYALKIVNIEIPQKTEKVAIYNFMNEQVSLLRERDVMLMVDHPFICKLRASWVEKFTHKTLRYLFLMEYAPFGDLLSFFSIFHKTWPSNVYSLNDSALLEKIDESRRDSAQENSPHDSAMRQILIYIYAAEMGSAIEYLHSLKIVHRDLKPENVLIGRDYHLRLTDFGFVNSKRAYHSFAFHSLTETVRDKLMLTNDPMKNDLGADGLLRGTDEFNATPEILLGEIEETSSFFPMDMWSLGIVLFMLYCNIQPFYGDIPSARSYAELIMVKQKIIGYRESRILNEPLYSALIDDEYYRHIVSGLLCDVKDRYSSFYTLNLLASMLENLNMNIDDLSDYNLYFMKDAVKPTFPLEQPYQKWSLPETSPGSPQGAPAMMKAFPFCSDSSLIQKTN